MKFFISSKITVCVCSDESVKEDQDDFVSYTYDLGIEVTTDKRQIKKFLKTKSKNIKVSERKILPSEMSQFVGCFLTGTAAEITPVSQIDKFKFEVCNLIKDLSENYQKLVRKKFAA